MKVLSQVPVNVFIHVSALVITLTIFLCYGIAVGLGHVKAWLPMISDCAVLPPEKYPFRYVGRIWYVNAKLHALRPVARVVK